jgi:hypothetical protein
MSSSLLSGRFARRRVLTLAGRSRIHKDVVEKFGRPYGGVVDLVIAELEARGFFEVEDGYWGGVVPNERARPSRRQQRRNARRLSALRVDLATIEEEEARDAA